MVDRLLTVLGSALMLALVASPAAAQICQLDCGPRPLPEPATMTIFAVGAAGAFIIKKFIGRK